jgi:hypothetical protein
VTHNGRIIEKGQYEYGVLKHGSKTRLTGTLFQGNFNEDGKLIGQGTIRHANGDKEDGKFEGGKLIKGEQKYDYGTREIGTFDENGQLHGPHCMQIFPGGAVHRGTFFKGDLREGERRVVVTSLDGPQVIQIQSGLFKDGGPAGQISIREVPFSEETLLLNVIP